MSIEQIRSYVSTTPSVKGMLPDTKGIADTLSVGRVKLEKTKIGIGDIIRSIGLSRGNQFIDAFKGDLESKYLCALLDRDNLDVSDANVRTKISEFVSLGKLTAQELSSILSLAEIPDPIDETDVKKAIWSDSGELMI